MQKKLATTNLLDQQRRSKAAHTKETQKSILERYQQSHNFVMPKLKAERVIGNGAFGYVFEAYCENRQ